MLLMVRNGKEFGCPFKRSMEVYVECDNIYTASICYVLYRVYYLFKCVSLYPISHCMCTKYYGCIVVFLTMHSYVRHVS